MSNRLIGRISTVFGAPEHSTDPAAFIAELARVTRSYTEAELDKAADALLVTFVPTNRKPWPTPAEICAACQDARDLLNPPKPVPYRYPDWAPESIAKAYRLIVSDVGRRAGDEGWILSLWDFCRKQQRLPSVSEQATLKGYAHGFNDAFASVERGKTPLDQMLKKLGETMLRRRDKLARMAHGEIVETANLSPVSSRMTGERDE